MKKLIRKNEPIVPFDDYLTLRNPHLIGKVESYDPITRKIKISCLKGSSKGIVGILSENIHPFQRENVLLQHKRTGDSSLLKIKDVSQKSWKTGQKYDPQFEECILFDSYEVVHFSRKKTKDLMNISIAQLSWWCTSNWLTNRWIFQRFFWWKIIFHFLGGGCFGFL